MPQCNTLRKWRSQAIWKASLEPVYNILIVLVCRLHQGIYWNNVLFCRMKRRNLVMLVSSLMSSLIVHYLRYAYFSSNYFNEVIWKFIHWNQLDFCPLPPPLRNWHLCYLLLANNIKVSVPIIKRTVIFCVDLLWQGFRDTKDILMVHKIVSEMKTYIGFSIDRTAYTAAIDAFLNCDAIKGMPYTKRFKLPIYSYAFWVWNDTHHCTLHQLFCSVAGLVLCFCL